MDELTLFAELRPDDRLTPADLRSLRAELFPAVEPSTPVTTETDAGAAVVIPLTRVPESDGAVQQHRLRVAVAAAVVAVVGLGGLWVASDRSDGPAPAEPASQPPEVAPASFPAAAGTYDVPLIGFAEAGWTVVGAFDDTSGLRRTAVFLSAASFDGPWVEITASGSGTETVVTVPSGEGTVEVAGHRAEVTAIDDGVILRWTDATGTRIEAFGWNAELDQTVAIAERAVVTDTGITIDALPAGASLADPAALGALGKHLGYRFAHPDGREVEVTFQPGGARGLYQRQGPVDDFPLEGRAPITIDGEPATIVHYDQAAADASSPCCAYRVDVQRGFWTWEFNTAGFTSQQQVIDLVAGSTIVDADTWKASLSDGVISPDQRPGVIDDLLVDVPLPPGLDVEGLTTAATEDRYQLIAFVSGAVACGWFDEWRTADAATDSVRRGDAAAALATAHDWTMLDEIADQGGWAQAVWALADFVNGVDSPVEATPGNIDDALGCERFG